MEALDDLGIDEFCARVIDGESYTSIARDIGVSPASIVNWLALDSERSARVREANILSARTAEEKAESVLLDHQIPVDRARELASHYRWRAKMRDRRQYGDQVQIDGKIDHNNLSDEEMQKRMRAIAEQLAAESAPVALDAATSNAMGQAMAEEANQANTPTGFGGGQ